MKKYLSLFLAMMVTFGGSIFAQEEDRRGGPRSENRKPGGRGEGEKGRRSGGPRPTDLGESDAELGAAGIAWYPILEDGLAEAKRTNKPILFMAVASQCNGISGVF